MQLIIKASQRKELGRKVKKLRNEGLLPGNIYGKNVKSQSVTVNLKDFKKLFKEAGETNIVYVTHEGKKRPTLIHNIQVDPVTDVPLHVEFLQVDLKQKVIAQIPVELVGESPAEKQGLGTIVQYVDEIEVEALPTQLPENFEVNVSKLEKVDDSIQIKQIDVDEKVEVKEDTEKVVVKVEALRKEEEVPEKKVEVEGEEVEVEEVEVEGEEGKKEEESKKSKEQTVSEKKLEG